MRVSVLGAAEARIAGAPVDLGTRKQRALLAALALHRGRPVSPDTLVSLLWADAPPPGVTGTLQGYVAGLRRALEPARPARAPSTVLVTEGAGYALHVPAEHLDAACFDAVVGTVHQRLGSPTLVSAPPPTGAAAHEPAASCPPTSSGWSSTSTRRWRCGAGRRTPISRTPRPPPPSGSGSRSCGWSRSRTGPSRGSPSGGTPPSRPSSRR